MKKLTAASLRILTTLAAGGQLHKPSLMSRNYSMSDATGLGGEFNIPPARVNNLYRLGLIDSDRPRAPIHLTAAGRAVVDADPRRRDVRGGHDCRHEGMTGLPTCLVCHERLAPKES